MAGENLEIVYLGLIGKGPNWTPDETPEIEALQEAHLANIRRIHDMGWLSVAGPLLDGGDLRGIYIFKTPTLEQAEALCQTDPMVQSGRLVITLYQWAVPHGALP